MNYEIILRDKTQIKITEQDYNNISRFLGKLKLFKLSNGQIINAVDISRISSVAEQQVISKKFRLSEPKFEKVGMVKKMKKLFDLLKIKGLFKEYQSYEEWYDKKNN